MSIELTKNWGDSSYLVYGFSKLGVKYRILKKSHFSHHFFTKMKIKVSGYKSKKILKEKKNIKKIPMQYIG